MVRPERFGYSANRSTMRIGFISAVFPPEPEPSSVMTAELVRAWKAAAHEVFVICPSPNRPAGVVYPGFERRLWRVDSYHGARCIRVRSWLIGSERRPVDRVLENVGFGLMSSLALLLNQRPDVVILESWPVLASSMALGVCAARGIKVINYIKDIYPEAATAAGVVPEGSRIASLLRRMDRWVCARADRNVVISEGAATFLSRARQLPARKFTVVPDWLDLASIAPTTGGPAWRDEVGISREEFVCMFAGTMGLVSRVDVLVEVAERLQRMHGESKIRLVCVGRGLLKPRMEEEIVRRGLKNLTLLPFQPRERVSDAQSAADVMLLTTSAQVGTTSVPNKLITYLAVAKPVICAIPADTDAAALVRECGLGMVVPPENPSVLADAIQTMAAMERAAVAEMGQRSRAVALERYSLQSAVASFERLFAEIQQA
jgi:colanic acid biosynthesis glycosyl transferase WcaI